MPDAELVAYQLELSNSLRRIFPQTPVAVEWRALRGVRSYAPVIDIAVGPFAEVDRHVETYDELMRVSRGLIDSLITRHSQNLGLAANAGRPSFESLLAHNYNARCLLAIEIENQVSRKHLMGGAINAAALGRIGLAVAWNAANLRAFVRLHHYLSFLGERGKPTFPTKNLLVLTREQLTEAVQNA